ncbi:hypothetical protein ACU4GD_17705 [Cupriavidus basilensis]
MRTTAVRDGDEYVINGSKTFISQRPECRPDHHGLQDRSQRRLQGREPDRGGSRTAKASAAAASSTRWASTPPTPPNSSSTTCACLPATASARKASGFAYLMGELPQERLSIAV